MAPVYALTVNEMSHSCGEYFQRYKHDFPIKKVRAVSAFFDGLLDVVTIIVLGASFCLGYLNFRFLQKQSKGGRLHTSISEFNLHRDELETILALREVPHEDWTPEMEKAASIICLYLFHLGRMIKHGHTTRDYCELYCFKIPVVREICDPCICKLREERHPQYWRKFDDLARFTMDYTKSHAGGIYYIECKVNLLEDLEEVVG